MGGMLNALLGSIAPTISSLTFNAGGAQYTDGNSQTVAGLSIGTANVNRYVVVVVRTRNSTTSEDALVASVTVAGQSCSLVAFVDNTSGTTGVANSIYVTDNPVTTGTTADIVVTAPVGETLTATIVSSYSLITFGTKPRVINTYFVSSTASTGGVTLNRTIWRPGIFGIIAGAAATNSALTNFTMSGSGVVTQDYYSGLTEPSALITGTIIGSGSITFTTTGSLSTTRIVGAVWA